MVSEFILALGLYNRRYPSAANSCFSVGGVLARRPAYKTCSLTFLTSAVALDVPRRLAPCANGSRATVGSAILAEAGPRFSDEPTHHYDHRGESNPEVDDLAPAFGVAVATVGRIHRLPRNITRTKYGRGCQRTGALRGRDGLLLPPCRTRSRGGPGRCAWICRVPERSPW